MQIENDFPPGMREALRMRFETALTRKSVGAVRQVAVFLLRLEKSGVSYPHCVQLLERAYRTVLGNTEKGIGTDASRRRKSYAQEAFHLIRHELRILRGHPPSKARSFSVGHLSNKLTAHIDGSVRKGTAAVGVLLTEGHRDLVTASMTVDARNSAEAEMHALLVALKTALALGYSELKVQTDAEALITLLEEKSRLRFHKVGREILRILPRFGGLAVVVVPRLYNHRADHLALERTGAA
jgi:ribonuclease HI